jgi:hypothetical protein
MQARRTIAAFVLAALTGGLGLPWIGEAHRFNDDPHWAVALDTGLQCQTTLTSDRPGDDSHCEVCHWLRTMRTAERPVQVSVARDADVQAAVIAADADTRPASGRGDSARAPPTLLSLAS